MANTNLSKIPQHKREEVQLAQAERESPEEVLADTPAIEEVSSEPDAGAWRGRYEKLEAETRPILENHTFLQGKLIEQQERYKALESEAARVKELESKLAELETKAKKDQPIWNAEQRAKWVDRLGEDGAADFEAELLSARRYAVDQSLSEASQRFDGKFQTREEFEKVTSKQKEEQFLLALPKEFFQRLEQDAFKKWTSETIDGRRSIREEIAEIVKSRDASGIDYIKQKLEQFAESKKQAKPVASFPAKTSSVPSYQRQTVSDGAVNSNLKSATRAKNFGQVKAIFEGLNQ